MVAARLARAIDLNAATPARFRASPTAPGGDRLGEQLGVGEDERGQAVREGGAAMLAFIAILGVAMVRVVRNF